MLATSGICLHLLPSTISQNLFIHSLTLATLINDVLAALISELDQNDLNAYLHDLK